MEREALKPSATDNCKPSSTELEQYLKINARVMKEFVKLGKRVKGFSNAGNYLLETNFGRKLALYKYYSYYGAGILWRLFKKSNYASIQLTDKEIEDEIKCCYGSEIFEIELIIVGEEEFHAFCNSIRIFLAKQRPIYYSGFRGACAQKWEKLTYSKGFKKV